MFHFITLLYHSNAIVSNIKKTCYQRKFLVFNMMDFGKRIFNQCIKELKRIFTDPGSLLILVLAALMYSTVYSLPYATEVIVKVPIGMFDADNSKLSRELTERITSSPEIDVVSSPENLQIAKQELHQQKIYAYLKIPKDFSRDIKRHKKTVVSLYADSGYLI